MWGHPSVHNPAPGFSSSPLWPAIPSPPRLPTSGTGKRGQGTTAATLYVSLACSVALRLLHHITRLWVFLHAVFKPSDTLLGLPLCVGIHPCQPYLPFLPSSLPPICRFRSLFSLPKFRLFHFGGVITPSIEFYFSLYSLKKIKHLRLWVPNRDNLRLWISNKDKASCMFCTEFPPLLLSARLVILGSFTF